MRRGRGSAPDGYAMVYAADGGLVWGTRIIGRGKKAVRAIAFEHDELLIAGNFTDRLKLGDNTLITRGGSDMFLGHFGSTGSLRYAYHWGGADRDSVAAIVSTPSGALLAGTTDGALRLGADQHQSAGALDVVLWRASHGEVIAPSVRIGGSGDESPFRFEGHTAALYGQFSGESDLGLGAIVPRGNDPQAFAIELSPKLEVVAARAHDEAIIMPTTSPSIRLVQTKTGALLSF